MQTLWQNSGDNMDIKEPKIPNVFLTVIIRNDAPMHYAGDSPTYRSVKIELTEEQKKKIGLRWIGCQSVLDEFEEISQCFLESNND